jgi:hypothetical protein
MPGGANFFARGNIHTAAFVKEDTATNFGVLEAGANDKVIGVSQDGTHDTPGLTGAGVYAATNGQGIQVFQDGDECLITVGTGGVTAGDLVQAGSTGTAVTLSLATGNNYVGGRMLETGAAGDLRRMLVQPSLVWHS